METRRWRLGGRIFPGAKKGNVAGKLRGLLVSVSRCVAGKAPVNREMASPLREGVGCEEGESVEKKTELVAAIPGADSGGARKLSAGWLQHVSPPVYGCRRHLTEGHLSRSRSADVRKRALPPASR